MTPRGPREERRPEDPAAAIMAVRIAVGEAPESLDATVSDVYGGKRKPKNLAAVALGRLGNQRGGSRARGNAMQRRASRNCPSGGRCAVEQ